MVHRRLVVWALATAVLALAIGWSHGGLHDRTGEGAAAASRAVASTVAAATAPTGPDALPGGAGSHTGTGADRGTRAVEGTGDGTRGGDVPCVMRADCAGALVLGGLGLVLALPAAAPAVGGLAPASPVVPATPSWHPTPRATRFFRPPRLSCALS